MSEYSEVSQCEQFAAEALCGTRVASVVDPSSIISNWLDATGAERIELWDQRDQLTEATAREATRDAHAVVIDLDLGTARAFRLAGMVSPPCGVLFTAESIDAAIGSKIRHPHWGYRSKQTSRGDFLLALRRVVRLYIPDVARLAAHAVQLWSLSPQQARVLHYNLWSYCDQDIADALDVSIHTVQEYQNGLRKKSGARSKQGYLARLLEVSGTQQAPLPPTAARRSRGASASRARTAERVATRDYARALVETHELHG
jgi:DNA-binding NarL/FixJ family response regulator